jgi:dienelactone hydrolase
MRVFRNVVLSALVLVPTLASAQTPPTTATGPAPSASLRPPADAPPPHPVAPGPYAVSVIAEPTLITHTVYRPSDLSPFTGAKRLPIVAWGNGACSNAGLLFETFLTQIASHGFLAIASGPKDAPLPAFASQVPGQARSTPNPAANIAAGRTTDQDLVKAIDWAIAENSRKDSPYFGRLDPEKVAVMGQSCGGLQATAVAGDPRVKTVVIWNSGVFPDNSNSQGAAMSGATKASLDRFHTPVAYFLGGPTDLAYANGKDDFSRLKTVPAFLGSIHSGHGGTYMHTGGGWFGEVGVAWLMWRLNGDRQSARYFEGADCVLCKNPIWEVARKNMQ